MTSTTAASPSDPASSTPTAQPGQTDAVEEDVAVLAQSELEKGNADQALGLLRRLPDTPSTTLNRLLCQFTIDHDSDAFLKGLDEVQGLEPDQQLLVDYNRALIWSQKQRRIQDAIDLLERRRCLMSESRDVPLDEKLVIQVLFLLAVLHMETRKNLTTALSLLQEVGERSESAGHAVPARLQLLKAKCHMQLGCVKTAKRELKNAPYEPMIRCHLELYRGNCKKAMKILNANVADVNSSVANKNNEALILFGLGKRNTAAFHLTKLIPDHSTPEILYNLALVHLFTGNTQNARRIFEHLIQFYRNNPRLWLRLAECQLQHESAAFSRDLDSGRQKHDLMKGFGGEAGSKKLILKASDAKVYDIESMTFARSCLMNALTVLKSPDASSLPSNVMQESELTRFKESLFLSLSFVNLCLSDFVPALTYAKCALHLQPKGYHKVLANAYAGEALMSLDRTSDAVPHFAPSLTNEEPAPTSEQESTPAPVPECNLFPHTARVILLYNQAVCHALRTDFEKAADSLRQIVSLASQSETVVPVQAITLVAYLQSQHGNGESIKSLARQLFLQFR